MMICKNCGSQLDDNVKFCGVCGAKQAAAAPQNNAAVYPRTARAAKRVDAPAAPVYSAQPVLPQETGSGALKIVLISVISVLVFAGILIAIILIGGSAKAKLDVEPYVIIEPEGFEGKGTARISIDRGAIAEFLLENYKKLSVFEVEKLATSINVEPSASENLSNGQEITLKLKYNADLAKKKKVRFAKEEWTYKFGENDFRGIKEIDPLADDVVKVEFTGIAPAVQVNIDYRPVNDELGTLRYESSYNYGDSVNIGDTITVTCTSDEDSLLEMGYTLKEKERSYTLEADMVDVYVDSPAMIDEDALNTMKKEAEDIINKAMVDYDEYGELVKTKKPVFKGVAVLKSKENTYDANNYVYLVYRVKCSSLVDPNSEDNTNEYYFDPVKMYIPVEFTGVVKYKDGKVSFDNVNKDLHTSDIPFVNDWGLRYLKGYKSADEMFTDLIRKRTDSYNYTLDDNLKPLF